MIKNKLLFLLLVVISVLFVNCKDELRNTDKFERPGWLAGKLYEQIKAQPELSTFTRCLELTGYDTIINTAGSYTAFVPNNEAFDLYFQNHPEYKSVEDIPLDELLGIVKYHLVQNPWSLAQLRKLDVYGWIDTTDINNDEPKGYKRETLLRDKNEKYGVLIDEDDQLNIVDTLILQTSWRRRQVTDARKYAPIFYKEYFDIHNLKSQDYEFYFKRPFESTNDIYFLEGRITRGDIFAENGFVHIIDRVVTPLLNGYQMLKSQNENHSYAKFFDLVNKFPTFTFNRDKTNAQPGAHEGYAVDSLFDITFPELIFDLLSEKTKAPAGTVGLPSNVTIRYHNGLIAPTNEAMDEFVNEYFIGSGKWGSIKNAPRHIKRMITNTYLTNNPIYPSDFERGFYNGEKDIVKLNASTIIQQQYGSNCTFIGVNKAIAPRAFKSVTGPIYLNVGYSTAMYAIEEAGLLDALKKENETYLLFVESDLNCINDSSLWYNLNQNVFTAYQTTGGKATKYTLVQSDLRTLLLNHVGTQLPKGIARKEFIPNLAGNFLIFNNVTHEVTGTTQTKRGFKGAIPVTVIPTQISTNADNGITYDITNWFNFSTSSLYTEISTSHKKFHNLLVSAGLANVNEYRYLFLSENEFYTVFAPTDSAMNNYRTDTLTTPQLQRFLMSHFIQGNFIFTDGNKSAGYYETARIDEKSTSYNTVYTKLYINPGIDVINIPDKAGNNYVSIQESPDANLIMGRMIGVSTDNIQNLVSSAVIHRINKVLKVEELDTK